MKTQRQSSFEWLRIIAMFLIILHHSVIHGVFSPLPSADILAQYTTATLTSDLLQMFGKYGVIIFVMISGYFLVNTAYNYKKVWYKIILLVGKMCFYSYAIYLLAVDLHWMQPQPFVKVLLAPMSSYWFVKDYILLLLVTPFINRMLQQLNKREHQQLIFSGIVIDCLFTMVFTSLYSQDTFAELCYFMLFYIIGAYIRRYTYKDNAARERRLGLMLLLVSYGILAGMIAGMWCYAAYSGKSIWTYHALSLTGETRLCILFMAIGTMLWVKQWKMGYHPVINTVAQATLGIYLIHDTDYLRDHLWINFGHMNQLLTAHSPLKIVIQTLSMSLLVFMVCACIEIVRHACCQGIATVYHKCKQRIQMAK